jgi:hypothetical protein
VGVGVGVDVAVGVTVAVGEGDGVDVARIDGSSSISGRLSQPVSAMSNAKINNVYFRIQALCCKDDAVSTLHS